MESVMSLPANTPEVEVSSKPTRRRFTADYKRKILKEAAGCTERGAIGALLRREGLYSSHLIAWREAAERGELAGLTSKKRGPKAKVVDARDRELAEKNREIVKLKKRIERAEVMLDIQKKVAELLGIALPPPPSDEES
jgi:transposase-like protein